MEREGENQEPEESQDKGSTSVAVYDPLHAYLMEIRRYPFLSREEEFRLSVKFREEGDLDAVARLVMANLQVVVKIAMEYKRVAIPLLDLIQEGNIGLMQAVKRFDPYRGTRISTYAAWWVRAYILRYIIRNWRLVKIGTTAEERRLFFNLRREKERLEALGYDGSPKLLAERLDVNEQKLIEMDQRLGETDLSLDEPFGDSKEGLGAVLPLVAKGVDEHLEEKELKQLLREKLKEFRKSLKTRDQEILDKRILAESPVTLQSLADTYHISKERVRQLEERLFEQLKGYLKREFKTMDKLPLSGQSEQKEKRGKKTSPLS